MIRRLPLALFLLAGAGLLASCSTFDRSDTAAVVGGVELSKADLSTLSGGSTDGDQLRSVINRWIQATILGADVAGVTSMDDLSAVTGEAVTMAVAPLSDEARAVYETGLDSPLVCLRAIPLDEDTSADEVLAALDAGQSFADAASTFAVDPSLAEGGGVLTDQSGNECFPTTGLTPELVEAMTDAGAEVGTPVAVELATVSAVILLRPWEEFPATQMGGLVPDQLKSLMTDLVDGSDVWVDSRYGAWDAATASVVAPAG